MITEIEFNRYVNENRRKLGLVYDERDTYHQSLKDIPRPTVWDDMDNYLLGLSLYPVNYFTDFHHVLKAKLKAAYPNITFNYLEYMGDSLLRALIAIDLSDKTLIDYSNGREFINNSYTMTMYSITLLSNDTFECFARRKGLCFINNENVTGKTCADIFEAIIGALYYHLNLKHPDVNPLTELSLWMKRNWYNEEIINKLSSKTKVCNNNVDENINTMILKDDKVYNFVNKCTKQTVCPVSDYGMTLNQDYENLVNKINSRLLPDQQITEKFLFDMKKEDRLSFIKNLFNVLNKNKTGSDIEIISTNTNSYIDKETRKSVTASVELESTFVGRSFEGKGPTYKYAMINLYNKFIKFANFTEFFNIGFIPEYSPDFHDIDESGNIIDKTFKKFNFPKTKEPKSPIFVFNQKYPDAKSSQRSDIKIPQRSQSKLEKNK